MADTRTLFIGNYDQAIHVQPVEKERWKVQGKLARKCREVSPRVLHMLGQGDAAILYDPLDPAFEEYLKQLYDGDVPQVYAAQPSTDRSQELKLTQDIVNDLELCQALTSMQVSAHWAIQPFFEHPDIHGIASILGGIPVRGMSFASVKQGKAVSLNDKACFKRQCRNLGVSVPPGDLACGKEEVVKAVTNLFTDPKLDEVMLRLARANGGLGNRIIHRKDSQAELQALLQPGTPWGEEEVLVEPLLDLHSSPSVQFFIRDDGGVRLLTHATQSIKGTSYIGGIMPCGLSQETVDQMVGEGRLYASWAAREGARGYLGLDCGVKKSGDIVFFESNYRITASNHVTAIQMRLRPDAAQGIIAYSCDALPIPMSCGLEEILNYLEQKKIAWSPKMGSGIVISTPPAGGMMGFVALAESRACAMKLARSMSSLSPKSL